MNIRLDPPDDMTGADALADTIGGAFDIPEMDLDNQLAGIDTTPPNETTPSENSITPTSIENSDMASDLGDLF